GGIKAGGPLLYTRLARPVASRRLLGPLGARRQHGYDADLRGMGRQGEGQSHDRALVALGARPCGQASRLAVQPLLIRAFQEMGVAATRAIARARSCTKFSLVAAGKSRRFVLNTGAL